VAKRAVIKNVSHATASVLSPSNVPCVFLEGNEPGVESCKRCMVRHEVIQNDILAYVSHLSVILRTASEMRELEDNLQLRDSLGTSFSPKDFHFHKGN
jgi:hypothetical protein